MKLKLADIYIGKRRRKDLGDVEGLAADLRENGQITAITVRPRTEEEIELGIEESWVLVAGGRRLTAAYLLGWEEIEAFGREEMSEMKHRILELHENLKRQDMSWAEVDQAKAEILALRRLENPEITQAEVAKELKESPATFSRSIKAAEAIAETPELKQATSRKAAIRAAEMAEHFKNVSLRDVMDEQRSSRLQDLASQVVTAEAQDWLPGIKSKSVDLVFTDPPYGIDYWKSGHKMQTKGPGQALGISQFDDSMQPTLEMLTDLVPQWLRVLRETGWACIFLGRETYEFTRELFKRCCAEHGEYREGLTGNCPAHSDSSPCRFPVVPPVPWIWHRPNSRNRPRFPERHAMNFYELILVVNAGKGRLQFSCGNVLECDAEYGADRIHAHQKPVELAKMLVKRFTQIGDTVVDTSFGSGALLAGASALGRYVKGCDNNPTMREPALGFISKHFIPAPNTGRKMSEERYLKEAALVAEGVDNYEEVEVVDDE